MIRVPEDQPCRNKVYPVDAYWNGEKTNDYPLGSKSAAL
jgi:hypothetical protein